MKFFFQIVHLLRSHFLVVIPFQTVGDVYVELFDSYKVHVEFEYFYYSDFLRYF